MKKIFMFFIFLNSFLYFSCSDEDLKCVVDFTYHNNLLEFEIEIKNETNDNLILTDIGGSFSSIINGCCYLELYSHTDNLDLYLHGRDGIEKNYVLLPHKTINIKNKIKCTDKIEQVQPIVGYYFEKESNIPYLRQNFSGLKRVSYFNSLTTNQKLIFLKQTKRAYYEQYEMPLFVQNILYSLKKDSDFIGILINFSKDTNFYDKKGKRIFFLDDVLLMFKEIGYWDYEDVKDIDRGKLVDLQKILVSKVFEKIEQEDFFYSEEIYQHISCLFWGKFLFEVLEDTENAKFVKNIDDLYMLHLKNMMDSYNKDPDATLKKYNSQKPLLKS